MALHPDRIDHVITCISCQSPLWNMKILKRSGDTPISTQFTPIGHTVKHSDLMEECPKCERPFFGKNGEERIHRIYDPSTGQFHLI